ncbi:hypothetical protein JM83_0803 [Gillisia sp. Hel_I_86]|uniref:hypothetical protein n=1 Tax=Gillisia sp. Hel_I_86 TaxID=1249981 RepID=UPI00119C380B|nr:hypothetical protein [Gillisia sp. Hel_I_86]TVZ25864.1 hypothetical protein JM83_0803 [Gillisia sp. Hel_I_86]
MAFLDFISKLNYLPLPPKEPMFRFYVEKKARLNDTHIVHRVNCELLPDISGRIEIGVFIEPDLAEFKARELFPLVKLCKYCNKDQ